MDMGEVDPQIAELEAAFGFARTVALRTDARRCDLEQLKAMKQIVAGLQNTLDGFSADISCRAEELRGAGGSRSVDQAMNPGGREPPAKARAEKDRSRVFDAIPGLEDATKSGELPGAYTDIVAKATKGLDRELRAEFFRRHQNLAEVAVDLSETQFRRHVKELVDRVLFDAGVERAERQRRSRKASVWDDLETGMTKLRCEWDPDTGARISTAVEAEMDAIFHAKRDDTHDVRSREQVMADAVANLLCGAPVSQRSKGGTTLLVIADRDTVTNGPHDGSVREYGGGSPIAPTTLQRIVDDPTTDVRAVTVNEHGVVVAVGEAVLNEGRNQRYATPAQRLALRAMYRNCMIPGCTMPFDSCEIHHLTDWDHHGLTDLNNLGPLCSYHHHLVHREGWHLVLDPETRRLTITDPSGHRETHPFHGLAPPPGTHPRTDSRTDRAGSDEPRAGPGRAA